VLRQARSISGGQVCHAMAATRERHEAEKTWLKDVTSELANLWLRPYSADDRLPDGQMW
jgi:hypothetical protein